MKPLTEYLEDFDKQGCVVIPDFLSQEELESIRAEIKRLVCELDVTQQKTVLKTNAEYEPNQKILAELQTKYYLDSAHRMSYFFEEDALDDKGNLKVPKDVCLNKIGHGMHRHSEVFKRISFKKEVKDLVRALNFVDPVLLQSMFIFKNPRVGSKVTPHTDRTFLYTDPCKLVGLWFAIEDVTVENGCLWYIPGSHKTEHVTRRMVRNAEGTSVEFIGEQREFADDEFVPATVKAGGIVLIHGEVIHKSAHNLSEKPRPAYTFHVIDTHETVYAPDNWLQPTEESPFTKLYDN